MIKGFGEGRPLSFQCFQVTRDSDSLATKGRGRIVIGGLAQRKIYH